MTVEIKQEYTSDEIRENRRVWIEALESGDYTQCRGKLTDGTGYCCLGVAGVTLGFEVSVYDDEDGETYGLIDDETSYLGYEVRRMLGLNNPVPIPVGGPTDPACSCGSCPEDPRPVSLAELNDRLEWSFEEIAKLLREQPADWNGTARRSLVD